MPRYHVKYTDGSGTNFRYIEGPSIDWVQSHLVMKGARDVEVLREDVASAQGRQLHAEGRATPVAGGAVARRALLKVLPSFGLALAADVLRGSWPPWASLAVLVWASLAVLPIWANQVTERASVWHEWQRVLRWLPLLEWNPLVRAPAVRFTARARRARALVGLGRVEEGLALFDAAAAKGMVPRPTAQAMRSSLLLLARRHDEAIALRRAASESDPKMLWDTVIALLRYGGDVAEARALLASREGQAVTQLEQVARDYSRALLAIVDQRFSEALELLSTARGLAEQVMVSVPALRDSYQALIDAYRAIALAGSGDAVGAQRLFGSVTPFLVATGEEELLAQCREAIARAGMAQAVEGQVAPPSALHGSGTGARQAG